MPTKIGNASEICFCEEPSWICLSRLVGCLGRPGACSWFECHPRPRAGIHFCYHSEALSARQWRLTGRGRQHGSGHERSSTKGRTDAKDGGQCGPGGLNKAGNGDRPVLLGIRSRITTNAMCRACCVFARFEVKNGRTRLNFHLWEGVRGRCRVVMKGQLQNPNDALR